MEPAKIPLLDKLPGSLSTQERLNQAIELLESLVDSSSLSLKEECVDALDSFDQYDWCWKPGTDQTLFEELKFSAKQGTLSSQDFCSFLELVSVSGQFHVALLIYKAKCLVNSHKHHSQPPSKPSELSRGGNLDKDYLVQWEINETAANPIEAATNARSRQIAQATTATIFKVFDDNGDETVIDLLEPQKTL